MIFRLNYLNEKKKLKKKGKREAQIRVLKKFYLSIDIILIVNSLILMIITHHTKGQAREFLKQEALKEISEVSDFTLLHTRVFYVIAKYGLQLTAKEEGLLSGDEWSNPDCKAILMKRVVQFFDKHIK